MSGDFFRTSHLSYGGDSYTTEYHRQEIVCKGVFFIPYIVEKFNMLFL